MRINRILLFITKTRYKRKERHKSNTIQYNHFSAKSCYALKFTIVWYFFKHSPGWRPGFRVQVSQKNSAFFLLSFVEHTMQFLVCQRGPFATKCGFLFSRSLPSPVPAFPRLCLFFDISNKLYNEVVPEVQMSCT